MTLAESLSENENLREEIVGLKLQFLREQEKNKHFVEETSRLYEIIREFKRHRFGSRSERWESKEQLVFNEAEALAHSAPPDNETDDSEATVKSHTRKRGKRKPLP